MSTSTSSLVYGVACCDCRDLAAVQRMLDGRKADLVITSPPYAAQREYDKSSGFEPIRPENYVAWYKDVAHVIEQVLAPGGSYFLNIKEHVEGGERSLYVKDLVLAHRREWGWKYIDELCWKRQGFPGGYVGRFKNEWEPIFHFSRSTASELKFRPPSSDYSYDAKRQVTMGKQGSIGGGLRGSNARPGNVVDIGNSGTAGHPAAFPRALAEFFIKAFTDPGDVVFDPFCGSGATMAAAHVLGRSCFGCEISPAYTDVIARRIQTLRSESFRLAQDGRTFEQVKEYRLLQDQTLPASLSSSAE